MSQAWVKLYTDTPMDPKVRNMDAEQRWCWVGILCLAGRCDNGTLSGRLEVCEGVPMDDDGIADFLKVPHECWLSARERMLKLGMLQEVDGFLVVAHFPKRQAPSDPTASNRMRKLRERSKDVTRNVTRNKERMLRVEAEAEAEYRGEGEAPPPEPPSEPPVNIRDASFGPAQWARDVVADMEAALTARYPERTPLGLHDALQSAAAIARLQAAGKPRYTVRSVALWAVADVKYWAGVAQDGKAVERHWNKLLADYQAADGKARGNGKAAPEEDEIPKARRGDMSPMEWFAKNDAAAAAAKVAAASAPAGGAS